MGGRGQALKLTSEQKATIVKGVLDKSLREVPHGAPRVCRVPFSTGDVEVIQTVKVPVAVGLNHLVEGDSHHTSAGVKHCLKT